VDQGAWLASASSAVAVATAFLLRPRLAAGAVTLILAAAGAGIGWGGILLQADPSAGELVAAVAMLAVLVPAHVRIVLGPFGPRR
jgi:hypothetical protein